MSLIICKDLSLGYEGVEIAHIDRFEVNQSDYVCVIGENGSGKTTFMKTLLGLQSPLKGNIEFGDGLKKNEIGYLPQQSLVQRDFPASVWEVVISGCGNNMGLRPFYSKKEKETAQINISRLGLDGITKKCYRELSGGQQQRVLLARALCATKKILLLDEPVAGLDPKVTIELYDIINELNKKDGISIIMISHDVQSSLKYASHILHVGNDVFFGTKDEYYAKELKEFKESGVAV